MKSCKKVEIIKINLTELRHTMSYGKFQIKKEGIRSEGERNSR
jgi:hypothetical protein